jgi:hypothetical protein
VTSIVVSLFYVPVVFTHVDDFKQRTKRLFTTKQQAPASNDPMVPVSAKVADSQ